MKCLDRKLPRLARQLAVAAFVIAPSAPVLAADCAQWNVAGTHGLIQSNIDSGQMTLQQDGVQFKGQIQIQNKHRPSEADSYSDITRGDIVGSATGTRFEATVYWADSKVGVYSGQIGPQGLVVGRTYNKNNPSESADFHVSPALDCLAAPAPSAAASSKPVVALGRTNAPAPPPPKVSQLPGAKGQPLTAREQQMLGPKAAGGAAANAPRPTIAEPREGGTYAAQTPLSVRIVPAKGAADTAYRIEIQLQKNGFIWTAYAMLDAPASVAQSPQGYRGWGANPDPSQRWMTAVPGLYRVRVSASAPQAGQPGNWVLFKVAGGSEAASVSAPTIAVPREGATYLPQKPLKVRVVPAKNARDTSYRIEIQVQQLNGDWAVAMPALAVLASVVQSPQGYQGWGGKQQDPADSWKEALPGAYRVRVTVNAPQESPPGNWVTFKIAGTPGKPGSGDPGQAAAQPQPLAPTSPLAPKSSPVAGTAKSLDGSHNKVPAALLHPQDAPPKSMSAAPASTSLDAARNKSGPVLLNPQPLPPGGLQQAPSSLR